MRKSIVIITGLVIASFVIIYKDALAEDPTLPKIQRAIEEKGLSWTAGETSISRLSPEERRLRLGATPEKEDRISGTGSEKPPSATLAYPPPGIDWRNVSGQDWTTSIKDQSSCGSCVAFGTNAAIESRLEIYNNNSTLSPDLSEAHLFSCGGGNCDEGWYPSAAMNFAQYRGVVDEACFPYQPVDLPCAPCAGWESRVTKIGSWWGTSDVAVAKQAIADNGPVEVTMDVYTDFYYYTNGAYSYAWGEYEGGHAITVVGYDDVGGYWIVKNSWGTDWGESGWFRIAYGECNIVDAYLSFDRNYLRVVDASGNETNSIIPGNTLPLVLQNNANNGTGRITYSAGKQIGSPSPSSTFTLATIRFKAMAATTGTTVAFLTGTDVFYQGNSVLDSAYDGTVIITETPFRGEVTLQGRGSAGDSRWENFPLTVTFYPSGGSIPVGTYSAAADHYGVFGVAGASPGTYDVKVKNAHTLSTKRTNVVVPIDTEPVNFCTLLEGDANDDDRVAGADFSILATTYGLCQGQPGYDGRTDFNGDDCIGGADFSLLATNYGQQGPQPCSGASAVLLAVVQANTVDVSIQPPTKSVSVGEMFTLDIQIAASGQGVDAVDAYLSFDRNYLRVVDASGNETNSIVAGSTLPLMLQNSADNSAGHITYSAGKQLGSPSPNGTFVLATIRFKAIAETPPEGTPITFLGNTGVFYEGNSVLGKVSGGNVVIVGAATATPTPTPTHTPTLTTPTVTPTPTSIPGPPTLLEPADGAVLPQPVSPNEWYFSWNARRGPCSCSISIEGPGARHLGDSYVPWQEGYEYRYTTDEYLPDDALGPWYWSVWVYCPLASAKSETRTFWVEQAPTHTSTPTATPTNTPTSVSPGLIYLPIVVKAWPRHTYTDTHFHSNSHIYSDEHTCTNQHTNAIAFRPTHHQLRL